MGIIIDEIIVALTLTAGVAVLLTIITYFSTPILTKIFGDGSLEVYINSYINKCVESVLIWGRTRRTGPIMRIQLRRRYVRRYFTAYHHVVWLKGEDKQETRVYAQEFANIDHIAQDSAEQQEECPDVETLPSGSKKVNVKHKPTQKVIGKETKCC